MDKIRQWLYYFIIAIISFVAVCFLPLLGSSVGVGTAFPDTLFGWVVWGVTRTIVSVINVLVFHAFMCQAKLNVKNDENYKAARELLLEIKEKEVTPRSPRRWNVEQYGKKGVTIFLTTALAAVSLTQAVLTFDWISALTYLFTIVIGIVFGIFQMKAAEEYWTEEYYKYAVLKNKEEKEKEENDQLQRERVSEPGGTGETKPE